MPVRRVRRRTRRGCQPLYKRKKRLSTLELKQIYFEGRNLLHCTKCEYCGLRTRAPEIDHVTSLAMGGSNRKSNLVPCCRGCNRSKSYATIRQWLVRLNKSKRASDRNRYSRIIANHRYGKKRLSRRIHRVRDSLRR